MKRILLLIIALIRSIAAAMDPHTVSEVADTINQKLTAHIASTQALSIDDDATDWQWHEIGGSQELKRRNQLKAPNFNCMICASVENHQISDTDYYDCSAACKVCDTNFTTLRSLIVHYEINHRMKTYRNHDTLFCELCDQDILCANSIFDHYAIDHAHIFKKNDTELILKKNLDSLDFAVCYGSRSQLPLFQVARYANASVPASAHTRMIDAQQPAVLQHALSDRGLHVSRCKVCGGSEDHSKKGRSGEYSHSLACGVCDTKVTRIGDLKKHYRAVHKMPTFYGGPQELRTIMCSLCNHDIGWFDAMKDHFFSHHPHEIAKPATCIVCGRQEVHAIDAAHGEYSHPLECALCGKNELRLHKLKLHYAAHNMKVVNRRNTRSTLFCAVCEETLDCFDQIYPHYRIRHPDAIDAIS